MKICNEDCFNCKYSDCIRDEHHREAPEGKRMGDRIRTARLKMGLSQAKLAELLGVRPALLSLWETNTSGVSDANMEKLAALFPELKTK